MFRFALALAVLALVAASSARASIVEALTLEELVLESEHVVHARTVRSVGHYDGNVIVTSTTLEVIESAKGPTRAGGTLEVMHMGGVVGDLAMRVEGAPRFSVGSESVVFAGNVHGWTTPVGMSQGVMPVRVENGRRVALPGGMGLSLVRRQSNGRLSQAAGAMTTPRPVADLLGEVRTLVGARP